MLKHLRNLIAPVIAAVLAATMAHGAFYQWSKTSASNATADATINWSEGQSPSSVNDSARAMMARAAEYRDDISGLLATSGTSTAYTVTTNQGLASVPNDGQMISITVHATNGSASTLTADGGTTYPIQTAAGAVVPPNVLIAGSPYSVKFSSSASAWILRNFYGSPASVPIGGMISYTGTVSPNSNFVLPYGQCLSRTTYAAYFTLVSTTFGACDGVTTFAVPDIRGRVIAALDNLGGSAASVLTSTYFGASTTNLGSIGGSQSKQLVVSELPSITPAGSVSITSITMQTNVRTGLASPGGGSVTLASNAANAFGTATDVETFLSGTASFSGTAFGGNTPHAIVQPTMVLGYLLRVQ